MSQRLKDLERTMRIQREPPLNPYFSTVLPNFGDIVKHYAKLWNAGYSDWWLVVRFGSIAPGNSDSRVMRVSGYRFLAFAIVGDSDLNNSTLLKLTDNQPSNPLMNDFVSITNLAGDGTRPNLLFVPRVLENNAAITVEAKNVHASTTVTRIEVALRGVRYYTELGDIRHES